MESKPYMDDWHDLRERISLMCYQLLYLEKTRGLAYMGQSPLVVAINSGVVWFVRAPQLQGQGR